MRWALVLLWAHAARAECPPLDEGELRPLLELELGSRAVLLTVGCRDGRTELKRALAQPRSFVDAVQRARPTGGAGRLRDALPLA
jgi:hypothetical protein